MASDDTKPTLIEGYTYAAGDYPPEPTKPAVLSAARLAEIRERVSYTVIAEGHNEAIADRAALLRYLDALAAGEVPDGEALGRAVADVVEAHDYRPAHDDPGVGPAVLTRSMCEAIGLALYLQGRTAEEAHATIARLQAERDHLKRREESIIEACERVADGGQYRADIVSAIQSLRRDRDTARAELAESRAAGLKLVGEPRPLCDAARVEGARVERRHLLEQLAFFVKVHAETEDERARGAGGAG